MIDKLLIVDGSSLLSECFYGTLPMKMKMEKDKSKWSLWYHELMRNKEGIFTNGIYTAVNKIEKILESGAFSHIAFTFDVSKDTFRKRLYPEYKAQREESDACFKIQKEIFPKLLSDIGFPVFTSTEYEGDDIIGSLVKKFKGNIPITILSGDKDMTQLVDDGVTLWYSCKQAGKAEELFDEYTQGESDLTLSQYRLPDKVFPVTKNAVEFLMGVPASAVPDLKAMAGDTSDNYPGISGIGEKGAIALLRYFGSMRNMFEWIERLDANDKSAVQDFKDRYKEATGASLPLAKLRTVEAKQAGEFFLTISSIFCDINMNVNLENLRVKLNNEKRMEWYNRLEFYSIIRKLH